MNNSADDGRNYNLHRVSNTGPQIAPCSQPDNASDYFGPPLLLLSAASLYVPLLNARTMHTRFTTGFRYIPALQQTTTRFERSWNWPCTMHQATLSHEVLGRTGRRRQLPFPHMY
jgi:hypothetical protein